MLEECMREAHHHVLVEVFNHLHVLLVQLVELVVTRHLQVDSLSLKEASLDQVVVLSVDLLLNVVTC